MMLSPKPSRPDRRPYRSLLQLHPLEHRNAPAVFEVVNLNNDGAGSLRQAIVSANANAEADTITFAASLGTATITLTTGELLVTASHGVTLDGAGKIHQRRRQRQQFHRRR